MGGNATSLGNATLGDMTTLAKAAPANSTAGEAKAGNAPVANASADKTTTDDTGKPTSNILFSAVPLGNVDPEPEEASPSADATATKNTADIKGTGSSDSKSTIAKDGKKGLNSTEAGPLLNSSSNTPNGTQSAAEGDSSPMDFFDHFTVVSTLLFLLTATLFGMMVLITFYILKSVIDVHNKYKPEVTFDQVSRNAMLMNAMSHFPYSTFMLSEARDCPICFEQFANNSEVVQLKCNDNHIFHYECMEKYLISLERREARAGESRVGRPCPLCREEIVFHEATERQLK